MKPLTIKYSIDGQSHLVELEGRLYIVEDVYDTVVLHHYVDYDELDNPVI